MKSFYKAASLASLAFTLIACGAGQAHAAAVGAKTYVASDGQIFSTENVFTVNSGVIPGQLAVSYPNGVTTTFADANGSLLNKILVNNPQFVQVPGTNTWVDPNKAVRSLCYQGQSTYSMYAGANVQFNDGCAMITKTAQNSY